MAPISVTVFTGFLGISQRPSWLRIRYSPVSVAGAGKTSLILKCLPKLPRDCKVVLLKNEFGDVQGKPNAGRRRRLEWELTEDVVGIQWIASLRNKAICRL